MKRLQSDAGSPMELPDMHHVAAPAEGAKAPGLLVFQEAFGVNAHIRDVADRFAKQGYVAIAPELFHHWGRG